jgi:hypothetical protein
MYWDVTPCSLVNITDDLQMKQVRFDHGRPGYFSRYSDSLRAGRYNPIGGTKHSASVQTGGAHSDYYTLGAGSVTGIKRPQCAANHPPTSSAGVKEREELYLFSPSVPSWQSIG